MRMRKVSKKKTQLLKMKMDDQSSEFSSTQQRRDAHFHAFVSTVVSTTSFNVFILATIVLNAIIIAMETTSLSEKIPLFFVATDNIFLAIYIVEFLLKVYAEPLGYWKNNYNIFDFTVLLFTVLQSILTILFGETGLTALKVIRALRSLRTLRSISFSRGLQVLVTALIHTFRSAVFHLLLLLFIFMFLFAIMGYYFFGYEESGDKKNWGNFGIAMLSLFNYVTADGWTDLQAELSNHGYTGSEFFTIAFLFLGHFIFTNLFIGVVIMNIHSATKDHEAAQRAEKEAFIQNKKEAMIERQHEDVLEVLAKQKDSDFTNFQEMTEEFQRTLRHDDFIYTTDLCTTVPWMETMVASLTHLESSKYRVQQLHFEIAEVLAEVKELQLQKKLADSHQ